METVLQLNLGERIVVNQLCLEAKGPQSVMRTVKRAKYAIVARDIPESVNLRGLPKEDDILVECAFPEDAFSWLAELCANKNDWIGAWADWISTLCDKVTTAKLAKEKK